MKKLHTILGILLLAMTTFTLAGCNTEDDDIAYTLDGVWEGNMYMQSTDRYGHVYKANESLLQFDQDPFRYAQGTGRWIDYYSDAPWDYFASYIDWRVINREIQIYSRNEGRTYYIYDYRLNGRRFSGYIDDGQNQPVYFELVKTASRNWDDYDWGGYYYMKRQYAPARAMEQAAETPLRGIYRN